MRINPLFLAFYHPSSPFKQDWTRAYRTLRLAYGVPKWGGSRVTFLGVDSVFKLPYTRNGIVGNETEATMSVQEHSYAVAACEIAFYTANGLPVLRMERVEPVEISTLGSGWWEHVDCGQVGYTKNGDLVAYDYGE